MAKYSESFKYKVVQEYLHGPLGYPLLARKYGIKSKTQLQKWVAIYKKFGVERLYTKKNNGVYSVQFKLDVLSFMKRTGVSVVETALQFRLTNPPIIASWNKLFFKVVLKPQPDRKDAHPCLIKPRIRKVHHVSRIVSSVVSRN